MKFWELKSLEQMNTTEWESLCDGCGKCCLIKLEDEDTAEIHFTSVVCDLIDLSTCRCTNYAARCKLVPDCIDLKQHQNFKDYTWLPASCAYRLLADGKPLPSWHPLITGNPNSTRLAGVTISSYAVKESSVNANDLQHYILD